MVAASWSSVASAYVVLAKAARAGDPISDPWENFAAAAASTRDSPPAHARMMFRALTEIQKSRSADEIFVLDHGRGSGLNVFYLAGLGYRNVFAVNVNNETTHLNRILKEIFGIEETRFVTTDGGRLPFGDQTIDFIVSNQVLEHVSDDNIDTYYAEEGRVLKPEGGVFHEVPHLLIPYDSHARVWFAHWLPQFLKPLGYGVLKSIERREFLLHRGLFMTRHYDSFLFLRSRTYHRQQLMKHIGPFRDLTLDRLMEPYNFENHDPDSNSFYRRIMDRAVRLPVFGRWIAKIFCNFITMQTIAVRAEGDLSD